MEINNMRRNLSTSTASFIKLISPSSSTSNIKPSSSKYLLKYFLFILFLGFSIYYCLVWNSPPQHLDRRRFTDPSQSQLTIVLNTFKRHDMMQGKTVSFLIILFQLIEFRGALDHYLQCDVVKYIHVVWSEHDPPPERIVQKYKPVSGGPQIIFNVHEIDSLNNRFKPLQGPHTDAIFAVDDDMRVNCEELALGLEAWQMSPRTLVGFMPRLHLRRSDGSYDYVCWWWVWWRGAYSIVLTKAAFLHHDYLSLYSLQMPQTIRDLVNRRRNCEDIAMQFLVSNHSGLPPLYLQGHLTDLGPLGGISTSSNVLAARHMGERSSCVEDLVGLFGRDPLIRSHLSLQATSHRSSLFPSTWFEYISSDLWKWRKNKK